jgi:hypothetical protein
LEVSVLRVKEPNVKDENAIPDDSPLFSKLNPDKYSITDEDALKRLVGLRK